MNKTLYTLALLFAAATAPAVADSASDLLTAQSAYQHALKAANSNSGEIALLQSRLSAAEQRVQSAQAEVEKLRGQLLEASQQNNSYQENLKAAGEKLDAAWSATRNTPQP